MRYRAAGIEPASAGRKRGFDEHCSAPLKRLALASARLSDSTDQREIAEGDFLPLASTFVQKSPQAIHFFEFHYASDSPDRLLSLCPNVGTDPEPWTPSHGMSELTPSHADPEPC